jgi:branched-chain amino acid transport system substrate-binding protein
VRLRKSVTGIASAFSACCVMFGSVISCGVMPSSLVRAAEPITIGAVLPLSGDAARWGIPPRNAAELAIDEINGAGGIDGQTLRLMAEDDRCQPADGVAAFNKIMAAVTTPVILGAVCSSSTLAIAPLAEASKTVLISPASTSPKVTNAGDFVFRVISSGSLRGKVFAEYLYHERGLRRLAIMYINNEGGIGGSSSFKAQFAQLGGTIVREETYEQGVTDVRAQLTRIRDTNAEGVLVGSYPSDTVLALRQARELQLKLPLFFTTEAVQNPDVLRDAGDAANGAVYILAAPPSGQAPDAFDRAYEAKFGHKPELFAAEGYDIVRLVGHAIAATKNRPVSGPDIRDFLYRVRDYAGASGTITFDENGDVIKPYAIRTIEVGTPKTIFVK